jgi:hypothetical protein
VCVEVSPALSRSVLTSGALALDMQCEPAFCPKNFDSECIQR